jgi:hypothetical protein
MSWKDTASQVLKSSTLLPVYQFAGGLSEFWALIFGAACIVLAFKGKLDGNFAMAVTAISGILTAHDALDDYHSRKQRERDKDDLDKK